MRFRENSVSTEQWREGGRSQNWEEKRVKKRLCRKYCWPALIIFWGPIYTKNLNSKLDWCLAFTKCTKKCSTLKHHIVGYRPLTLSCLSILVQNHNVPGSSFMFVFLSFCLFVFLCVSFPPSDGSGRSGRGVAPSRPPGQPAPCCANYPPLKTTRSRTIAVLCFVTTVITYVTLWLITHTHKIHVKPIIHHIWIFSQLQRDLTMNCDKFWIN